MSEGKAEDPTKDELSSLLDTFTSFESKMKEGTRQRREKDEHQLEELRVEMGDLEKVLGEEVKRRVQMNKSLQVWCDEQIKHMHADLLGVIHERMNGLQDNIEKVSERIGDLEGMLAEEKVKIPADIERRGAELTQKLTEFQELFEIERKSRLVREKEIKSQLGDHETLVEKQFDEERNLREVKYMELRAILEKSTKLRKKRIERFNAFVEVEIAALKNDIARESILRKKEDDEIVETLKLYTSKLQASLRVINTTEV